MKKIPSCILISFFLSCTQSVENPLREPARFAEIYADILMVNPRANPASAPADSALRRAKVDSTLAAHGFTRGQLADAVSYFSENPKQWQEIYQNVIARLDSLSIQERRRSIYDAKPQLGQAETKQAE